MGDSLPPNLVCPITLELFEDPVIANDGITYERVALQGWIDSGHDLLPATNVRFNGVMTPNLAVKAMVAEYLGPGARAAQAAIGRAAAPEAAPASEGGKHLILVLDISTSMGQNVAMAGTEFANTRAQLVFFGGEFVARTLMPNDNLSLIVYGSSARVLINRARVSGTTGDSVKRALAAVQVEGATNIQDGLDMANRCISADDTDVHIVLLTDGSETVGNSQRTTLFDTDERRATLHTIAFGMTDPSYGSGMGVDPFKLIELADMGGGVFNFIPDVGFVGTVFTNLMVAINTPPVELNPEWYRACQRFVDELETLVRARRADPGIARAVLGPIGPLIPGLEIDLGSQIYPAFQPEYAEKWGWSYLNALIRAYRLCRRGNFKDRGMEIFVDAAAAEEYDRCERIFNQLTPPAPDARIQAARPGSQAIGSSLRINATSNPCVTNTSLVILGNGRVVHAPEVTPGTKVRTGNGGQATVTHVVITKGLAPDSEFVTMSQGLCITPTHPIRIDGVWKRPHEIGERKHHYGVEAIYSYALEEGCKCPTMVVGGHEIATLAHGLKGNVIEHSFLGERACLEGLDPVTTFNGGAIQRDATGYAVGWKMENRC